MFCRKCGNELPDTSQYCGKCGTKINSPKEMSAQPESTACINDTDERMLETLPFTYENYAKKMRLNARKQNPTRSDTPARIMDLLSLFSGCASLFLCRFPLLSFPLAFAGLILGLIGLSSNRPNLRNILGVILSVFGFFAASVVLLMSLASII